jgi:hypothetical protein
VNFDTRVLGVASSDWSLLLFRCAGTLFAKPGDDVLLASPKAAGRVQGSSLGVVGDPIEVSSSGEEVFRRPTLTACAGVPEGLRELTGFGSGLPGEEFLHADEHAEGSRVPELVDLGAAGDE